RALTRAGHWLPGDGAVSERCFKYYGPVEQTDFVKGGHASTDGGREQASMLRAPERDPLSSWDDPTECAAVIGGERHVPALVGRDAMPVRGDVNHEHVGIGGEPAERGTGI